MNLEQAEAIVKSLLTSEKEKKPYGEEYYVIQKQVKHIRPHADENYVPDDLVQKRAPNATDDQVQYIKKNWKCTTAPVFHELLNVIQRGFIDDNWQIIWNDEQEEMRIYCEEDFPKFGSTESFIKEIVPPLKYKDANCVLAVRPRSLPYMKDDEGNFIRTEDGSLLVDDTQRLEPAFYLHPSERVLMREESFILAIDEEKSLVEYNRKMVREGRVLFLYTKDNIYKIEQVGKKTDNKYDVYLYYQHDEGVIPATELKGIPQIISNGKVIQKSPFRFATDLLDLALTNKNYLQVSVNNVVFPFRIMMADKCTFATDEGYCQGGKWISNENGMHVGKCKSCGGSGNSVPYSPLGVYLYEKPDSFEGSSIPFKPVEFVEAPTQNLEFIENLVESDTDKAKAILHLQRTQSQRMTNDVTATESVYNDTGQISFVRYNVHQLFDLWYWALNRISWQRYDSYDYVPDLVYPRTFDFRSELDIWNQIKVARESEAPVSIIGDLFKSLVNNLYASSPRKMAIFETLTQADKLLALSGMDIASRKASNTIEGWEVVLHDSGLQLIGQLIREDDNYLDLELQERIDRLTELAKNSTFVAPTTNPVQRILEQTQQ